MTFIKRGIIAISILYVTMQNIVMLITENMYTVARTISELPLIFVKTGLKNVVSG